MNLIILVKTAYGELNIDAWLIKNGELTPVKIVSKMTNEPKLPKNSPLMTVPIFRESIKASKKFYEDKKKISFEEGVEVLATFTNDAGQTISYSIHNNMNEAGEIPKGYYRKLISLVSIIAGSALLLEHLFQWGYFELLDFPFGHEWYGLGLIVVGFLVSLKWTKK